MGWEVRGRCRFYTRSRKVAGRVVREYVGTGAVAELAAAADALRRADRRAAMEARRAEEANWQAALAPLLELSRVADLLGRAALVAGGGPRHGRTLGQHRRGHNSGNAPAAGR